MISRVVVSMEPPEANPHANEPGQYTGYHHRLDIKIFGWVITTHNVLEGIEMRSALMFLTALFVFLLGISAYELIVLVKRLPFEPSTISEIIGQALTPFLVAAAIVLPWRLFQNWRGRFSPMPMLVALVVVGYWQYQTYEALKESIGQ
jgi:hypothetical protein